jgi:hypothetical protein
MLLIGVQNAWGSQRERPEGHTGRDIASSSIRVVPIDGGAYRTRLAVSTYKAFDRRTARLVLRQIDSTATAPSTTS